MIKKISKVGTKITKHISPVQAVEGFTTIYKTITEYKTNKEKHKTLRKNIEIEKDIELERIKTQKEILLKYFEEIFQERKEIYKKQFDLLDKGIETQNIEMIQIACSSIITLAKDSPLKELEKFRTNNELGQEIKKIDHFEL